MDSLYSIGSVNVDTPSDPSMFLSKPSKSHWYDPIRRDVQWLKNKYWLFVGAMTVVMVLINLLPWAVSLITEK